MYRSRKKTKILSGMGALAMVLFPGNIDEETSKYAFNQTPQAYVINDKNEYSKSALENLVSVLEPKKALASSQNFFYEDAMNLSLEGQHLQTNGEYEKAIPLLEKSIDKWQSIPFEYLTKEVAENYGATLSSLGGCYVLSTIDSHLKKEEPDYKSEKRIEKGKNFAKSAIDVFNSISEISSSAPSEIGYIYSSKAFSTVELANLYIENPKKAKDKYENVIENKDKEKEMYGLKLLKEKY